MPVCRTHRRSRRFARRLGLRWPPPPSRSRTPSPGSGRPSTSATPTTTRTRSASAAPCRAPAGARTACTCASGAVPGLRRDLAGPLTTGGESGWESVGRGTWESRQSGWSFRSARRRAASGCAASCASSGAAAGASCAGRSARRRPGTGRPRAPIPGGYSRGRVRGEGVTPDARSRSSRWRWTLRCSSSRRPTGSERSGCLIGFATQCSVDPPRFLVCLSRHNHTCARRRRAPSVLVVHLVPSDAKDLAELFGEETGDEVDKFERVDWREGPGGRARARALRELVRRADPRALRRRATTGAPARADRRRRDATGVGPSGRRFREVRDLEPGHEA